MARRRASKSRRKNPTRKAVRAAARKRGHSLKVERDYQSAVRKQARRHASGYYGFRNPGESPGKLMAEYLRAVDAWYDMKMSKKAVAAIARKAIAAGCNRNRMDDLPTFLGRGAWGGES